MGKVVNTIHSKLIKLDKPKKNSFKNNKKVKKGAQTLEASTWINPKS